MALGFPAVAELVDPRARAAVTKQQRTRAKLIEAVDVVLKRDGFGAEVAAVAAEAGISKPSFYNFYATRNALAQEALSHLLASVDLECGFESLDEVLEPVDGLLRERRHLVAAGLIGRMEASAEARSRSRHDLSPSDLRDPVGQLSTTLISTSNKPLRTIETDTYTMAAMFILDEYAHGRQPPFDVLSKLLGGHT